MAANTAAWLSEPKARPFEVMPAPLVSPSEGQILVKNHAVAINPIDGKIQKLALLKIAYPAILGQDVAGEVIAVGPDVTRFKQGDRVVGVAAAFDTKRSEAAAFQTYTILDSHLTSEIPGSMSYETAVVLPLALTTASAGLFNVNFLNLQMPTNPRREPTGKSLLVWGGASSVGCNAIQLAAAAGYEVITTASAKNFDLVKKLGATQAYDYNRSTIVSDLVTAFHGKSLAGVYDAIGGPAMAPILEFLQKVDGNKFVSTVVAGFPDAPDGIRIGHVYSLSIRNNAIGKAVWEDFLPEALKKGTFVPAPDPYVIGKGLESIQDAVDFMSRGVSAQKVVVAL